MDYEIKKLTSEDADIYREIRLEALKTASENYGSSYEDESTKPRSFFENRISDGFVQYGLEEKAIKIDNKYINEILMVKFL